MFTWLGCLLVIIVIFVNENDEKRDNNKFVNEN